MTTIALLAAIGGALGGWLAIVNVFDYYTRRRDDRVRVVMRNHGRLTYGELWSETGLPQKQLDAALERLAAHDELHVYEDPATARKIVALRYGSQARRK